MPQFYRAVREMKTIAQLPADTKREYDENTEQPDRAGSPQRETSPRSDAGIQMVCTAKIATAGINRYAGSTKASSNSGLAAASKIEIRPLSGTRYWGLHKRGLPRSTADANLNCTGTLSNRFYELFLDPEMVYSCAYFRDWDNDIATAQQDKLHMICRKLRLKPGERMLDIGCGWGALICHAARHYGVYATGVTLATEQAELAREKIARLGLRDRVDVVLRDYAKLEGQFDKISSIGTPEYVKNSPYNPTISPR